MTRAIRCAGFVLKGIGGAVGLLTGGTLAIGVPMYLAVKTADALDLSDKAAPFFFLLYFAVVLGGAYGATRCWEDRS